MALIGTLRNKLGTWVVVFVFLAISAFILNDLLGSGSVLLGKNNVGEIGGTTISLSEYQDAIKEMEAGYTLNTNRQPGEREMISIRQQAWDKLIAKYTVQAEYEEVGVAVTTEEVVDMISGRNVDQNIRAAFTNPETGEFDRSQLTAYVQRINGEPPIDPRERSLWQEERYRWETFQSQLAPARERIKYENLLIKTNYVTAAEGQRDYRAQTDVAEVEYLYVPYFAVSDTAVNVTEEDLRSYYDKNREKYKTGHTKDINYVRFPVIPSPDDSLAAREEIESLKQEFAAAQNDSTFASINSDEKNAFATYPLATLPAVVQMDSLVPGKIVGPFIDNGAYKIYKTSQITKDTAYHARARHILVKWDNEGATAKAAAREKARAILRDIRNGADFASQARQFGTDATASRGGDLGWFQSGEMVKPFENAVFAATRPGLLGDVVETVNGYHVIDVTHVKDNNAYKIAIIAREITASDVTINDALRAAELFASDVSNAEGFAKKAESEGINLLSATSIEPTDRNVGLLGDARRLVQWLFRDAEKESVSEVFDLESEYVVAVETAETEEGYKPLDQVREQIMPAVTNEVKARAITERLNRLEGSLEEMAQSFGPDASYNTMNDIKLNASSLKGVNFDPRAVGLVFSLQDGERSKPFAGENGVVIIEMKHKTPAPDIADYTFYANQLNQRKTVNVTSYNIAEAIKDEAGIEDYRYRFY